MSAPLMNYLCFYADGPRADNLVRLPAFPTGVSYDRPFRYRDTWIDDALLEELRRNRNALDDQDIVLAMRFRDQAYQDVVVPMRLGTLQASAISPDQSQFYFRVGRLVDFANAQDLQDLAVTLQGPIAAASRGKLLIRLDAPAPIATSADEAEDASWTTLTGLIAKSATLPVSDDARRALYLRLQRPRARRRLTAKKVHRSWTSGDVYGFKLPERSEKELVVMHRLPALIDTQIALGARQELRFEEDSHAVVATPASSAISANYDRHVVTLGAERRTGSWIELQLTPSPEQVAAGQIQIVSYAISVPLKISLSPLYRLRTQIIPILFVAAALFASSYYTAYKSSAKVSPLSHKVVSSNPPYWPALIASTLASVVIFIFRR